MLINLSELPYEKWSKVRKDTAYMEYQNICDQILPEIQPIAEADEIKILAEKYAAECVHIFDMYYMPVSMAAENDAVFISGKSELHKEIAICLKNNGIKCISFI